MAHNQLSINTILLQNTDSLKNLADNMSAQTNGGDELITAISTIAAAISAIAALGTIWLTVRNRREERKQRRPYFLIEKPGFKSIPNDRVQLNITFKNKGDRPAKSFKGEIKIIDSDFDQTKEQHINFDIVNDIPSNYPTMWFNNEVYVPKNLSLQFIYCMVEYKDPIIDEKFQQEFYMKWQGAKDGKMHADFVHASKSDKEMIINYLKKNTT